MNWGSAAEFFAMGGYAGYVWGSFGVCAALMILEPILLRRRRSSVLREIRREIRAAQETNRETNKETHDETPT